jgi:hydroxymethylbilane synthase
MDRLGWRERVTDVLDPVDLLPQAGQGAVAVQCRADDGATRELVGAIDDRPSRRAIEAERAVLATLGGGCTMPVGAYALVEGDVLDLVGLVCSGDGRTLIRAGRRGTDPATLGAAVALALLEGGAAAIEGFDALVAEDAVRP